MFLFMVYTASQHYWRQGCSPTLLRAVNIADYEYGLSHVMQKKPCNSATKGLLLAMAGVLNMSNQKIQESTEKSMTMGKISIICNRRSS